MKRSYGFVILVLICFMLSAVSVAISLYEIGQNNNKFCQLVAISNQNPVPVSSNPASTPVRDREIAMGKAYSSFGVSLGC